MGVVEECKEIYYVKCTLAKTVHVMFTKFKSIEGITMSHFFSFYVVDYFVFQSAFGKGGCLVIG